MLNNNISLYALEKFELAVHELAIGTGNVKSRLIDAYSHIQTVRINELPKELQDDFKWIKQKLTKNKPQSDEGSVIATLYKMRLKTGAKIAEKIVYIEERLKEIDVF